VKISEPCSRTDNIKLESLICESVNKPVEDGDNTTRDTNGRPIFAPPPADVPVMYAIVETEGEPSVVVDEIPLDETYATALTVGTPIASDDATPDESTNCVYAICGSPTVADDAIPSTAIDATAATDAEQEAALRDLVDRGNELGRLDRITLHDQGHARAQQDRLRHRRRDGQ